MKLLFFVLFSVSIVCSNATGAQEIKPCTMKSFVKVYIKVDRAPEKGKQLAVAELKIARAKMAEGDYVACSFHLTNAYEIVSSD